jgi:arsenate reductase (thioredoxin)
MANAMFNLLADPSQARGVSAGTEPGERVHPECVVAMKELGIDMTNEQPRLLTKELASSANFLITMGCGEACPYVPGLKREDWPLEDPKGKSPEQVSSIRDDVQKRVTDFLARQGWRKELNQDDWTEQRDWNIDKTGNRWTDNKWQFYPYPVS